MARKHKGTLSELSKEIKPVVRQIGKSQKGVHPEIWARWIDIMGKDLATRAIPRSFQKGVLFIAVKSSTWMQELTYIKPTLIDKFESAVGSGVVREIRLVLDPSIPGPDGNSEVSKGS